MTLLLGAIEPDWERLGTAGLVAIGAFIVIGWLLRDRARTIADGKAAVDAERARAEKAEAQRDAMFDQQLEAATTLASLVERTGPIITANTETLQRVLERLRGSP